MAGKTNYSQNKQFPKQALPNKAQGGGGGVQKETISYENVSDQIIVEPNITTST